jgi:hypothetical protein
VRRISTIPLRAIYSSPVFPSLFILAIVARTSTAKMNSVEPYAYLRDVLQRMVDGYPVNRLDKLLPWNWKPPEAVRS